MPLSPYAADGTLQENLWVPQGSAWSRTWPVGGNTGQNIALDGWTARAHVRPYPESPTLLFSWTTLLNDGAGSAYFSVSAITLTLDGSESADWTFRRAVYDLYLFDPAGAPTRLVEGTFIVTPQVTRV